MANNKSAQPENKDKKIVLPFLKGGLGTVAAGLIIIGILLSWSLPFLIGFVLALRWAYLYQKEHPKAHLFWLIVIWLFIGLNLIIIIRDIKKFY